MDVFQLSLVVMVCLCGTTAGKAEVVDLSLGWNLSSALFFLLLFSYSYPPYPPINLPCPVQPSLLHSILPTVVLVHGSFIHIP